MEAIEMSVLSGGILLICLTLWYFFGGRRQSIAMTGRGGVQEIDVSIRGGYSPDVIVVKPNKPVRLNFYREETDSCSEQVIFGDFGIARELPAFQTTTIEFTPHKTGEFVFTCGMNMLRGRLIVREDAGVTPLNA